jgi:hypothetical protein
MSKKQKKHRKKKVKSVIPPHAPLTSNDQLRGLGLTYPITRDPAWMRLVIVLAYLATIILLAYIVKGVLLAVVTSGVAVHGIVQIWKMVKGKDP